MVEREARVAKERPLIAAVIYNRLQRGHAARHRRDDPLRDEQLDQAADASPSCSATRRTTRACTAGCRRRRSATPGSRRSRPPRTRPNVDYLFYVVKPGTCGEHAFSRTDAQFEQDVARLQRRARRERRQVARRSADAPPRRPRLAGRPQPLAGHAQRRAAPRSAWTTGATSGCRSRPSCSRRPCARCPAPGFAGANVTIPHKEAALALADDADRRGARDRRGQHAHLRRRRRDPRRQHRRAGPARRARRGGPRRDARWCSARAAARAPSCGRCCDAGAAEVLVWNRTPERAAELGAEVRPPADPSPRPTCWSTARASVSAIRPRLSSNCRFLPMRSARTRRWWIWSTGPAERHSSSQRVSAA